MKNREREQAIGVIYALAAFFSWGFLPIYWKLLGFITPLEILSHRMLWSFFFALLLLFLQKRLGEINVVLKDRKTLFLSIICALIIGGNWFVYIWSVSEARIVEASLGYYINPIFGILLSVVFLKEWLDRLQIVAVILAAIGVTYAVFNFGSFPWVALVLAFSFGFYSLLRKIVIIKPLVGMVIETAILSPFALLILRNNSTIPLLQFELSWWQISLIVGTGIATLLPLFWFTHAAQKLRLGTISFLQYIAPTIQLLIATLLYDEPFTTAHLVTFSFIWSALILYTLQSINNRERHGV